MKLSDYFPCLLWAKTYDSATLNNDLLAAIIVTIMLIPQSMAYALLAGLPPEIGLYASIAPLLAYAVFGTSRTLAVGPVAVISLMTAAAISQVASPGSAEYIAATLMLTMLSGVILTIMGVLRLGFLANLLSHPVITGFITASGILIAISQLKHILGINASGYALPELLTTIYAGLGALNWPTLLIGSLTILFLIFVRTSLNSILINFGLNTRIAATLTKIGPVMAVVISTLSVVIFGLDEQGVKVVGEIPTGLPSLTMPSLDMEIWQTLLPAAILISLIGFVESVSVGQTLASKRRERIAPNQELIGLGASNIAAAVTSGYPVTGGFARSVVNFDAGAKTPMAGALTAIGIALTSLFLTPLFKFLPIATLAATIIVAVLVLVDYQALGRSWNYSKNDFAAMMVTIICTLGFGVEVGVMTGIFVSVLLHLWRTSRPHVAIVGMVPGTQHFRNINRHQVDCCQTVLSVRIDESLYFANARFLEDTIYKLISDNTEIQHLVLMCPAVNDLDGSALKSLETINLHLADAGVIFHLSEVKGPVMDRLQKTKFLEDLTGEIFLSHYQAMKKLDDGFDQPAKESLES